jgi:outer membrane protein insertion porin family
MFMVRPLLAWSSCAVFVVVAAQPVVLFGQDRQFEGRQVLTIQFDPRVQPLDPEELHAILPLKIDAPLRMADVRASIARLFATGRYADIQVDAEPYKGGVIVRFLTKNSWFIGDVAVSGNVSSPPSSAQLENAARLDLGQPYTPEKLKQAILGQQRLLENNGLYRSTIKPLFDEDNSYQQMNIRFLVESGPRAHFGPPVLVGDLKMDPARVLAATKFRRWLIHTWKPVSQLRVRQGLDGVRSLYRKDNRLEAAVAMESMKYDPATNIATPTLRIDAGPRIEVRTIGAKVPESRLQRYVPVFEEHSVDRDLLAEGARNLKDYLQSQGYFDAQVEFKQQRVVNDRASIDYLIATGKRHKLAHIGIAGNKYFSTDTIRERMFLQTASILQFPHGRFSESMLRRDEDSITSLYESNGFRDVRITHQLLDDYRGKAGDLAVLIAIDEGPQFFIGKLTVDGVEKIDKSRILGMLSSMPGQPFSESNIAVDRDTILAQYFNRGFPGATFEWASSPGEAPNRVDLRFTIHEGEAQFVRQVVVSGLRNTNPSLVNRRLTLNPGDPLSPTEITDVQRRLYDLGVFARVDAAIQDPDGDTDRKYVLYNVDEARRYSVAVGLGAELGRIGGCQNCYDQPAGATGFSPRVSLDLTRNNLWGKAHSISWRNRVSTLEQRSLLNYSWPNFRDSDTLSLSFTGLFENSRDVRTFNYRREEVSTQLSQRVAKDLTLFYRFSYRRVSVGNLKITPYLVPQLSQPVRVGIPSFNLVQDRRDDPVDPHKGIYNTLDLGVASRIFGSQPNFVRFLARNATYHPLGKRLVLARSTEFGDIYPFRYTGDAAEAVPLAERFFGGGGNSHRGFWDYQAGPRDTSTGYNLGGNALLFNQTELRFPIIGDNLGGVLFHDMGNIYSSLGKLSFRVKQRRIPGTNQPDLTDFDYMVHAVGIGFRYRTPVGPLRVDLGYSINPPYFYGVKPGTTLTDLENAGQNPCASRPDLCIVQNGGHFRYFISIGQTF